jgi:hypothetical protein
MISSTLESNSNLPLPTSRKHSHTRSITFSGYERTDGLWDIDGHLQDSKPKLLKVQGRTWQAGDFIHDMWIRLTLNNDLFIIDIATTMISHPLMDCKEAIPPMRSLIGIQIGKGWRNKVNEHIGGSNGCTHLRELLQGIATAAYQTIPSAMHFNESLNEQRPHFIGTCKAWDESRSAVLTYYPSFYKPKKD